MEMMTWGAQRIAALFCVASRLYQAIYPGQKVLKSKLIERRAQYAND